MGNESCIDNYDPKIEQEILQKYVAKIQSMLSTNAIVTAVNFFDNRKSALDRSYILLFYS